MVPLSGESGWPGQRGDLLQVRDQAATSRAGGCPARRGHGVTTGGPSSPYSMRGTPAGDAGRRARSPRARRAPGWLGDLVAGPAGPARRRRRADDRRSGPSSRSSLVDRGTARRRRRLQASIAPRTASASASQPHDSTSDAVRAGGRREHGRLGGGEGQRAQQCRLQQVRVGHHPQPARAQPRSRSPAPSYDVGERAYRVVRRRQRRRRRRSTSRIVRVGRRSWPAPAGRRSASRGGRAAVARTGRAARRPGPAARWHQLGQPVARRGDQRRRPSARSRRSGP